MKNKILVVDDEQGILDLMNYGLNKAGFEVFTAHEAHEAIPLIKKENIQVAFIDLHLPGMSGIELCKQIRQERPVDCLYALTGHATVYNLVECREAGFDDYFTKPFELPTIIKAATEAFVRLERWKDLIRNRPPQNPNP